MSVEVPSLGWLTGAAVASMALLAAAEIVLAPLLPSPAPAAPVEHPSPPARRPERQHGHATSPGR